MTGEQEIARKSAVELKVTPNAGTSHTRRKVLSGTAIATSIVLPSEYLRPVINTVLLPAHAQTTETPEPPVEPPIVYTPQFGLIRVQSDSRIPSGELAPVSALSQVRLSACGLPPGDAITVTCTAGLAPTGSTLAFTQAATANSNGVLVLNAVINAIILIPLATLTDLQFQVAWRDGIETYTADPSAVSSAVGGSLPLVTCSST